MKLNIKRRSNPNNTLIEIAFERSIIKIGMMNIDEKINLNKKVENVDSQISF